MHEKVHGDDHETRRGVLIEYGVPLRSLRLGLSGKADVVELHRRDDDDMVGSRGRDGPAERRHPAGAGKVGSWSPFPVEYKRGRPKPDACDKIQLCAQAICLEEMMYTEIPCGAIFYGKTRRRLDVVFDEALRNETERAADRLHRLIASRVTPLPMFEPKCERCSFYDLCLPKTLSTRRSVSRYLKKALSEP